MLQSNEILLKVDLFMIDINGYFCDYTYISFRISMKHTSDCFHGSFNEKYYFAVTYSWFHKFSDSMTKSLTYKCHFVN